MSSLRVKTINGEFATGEYAGYLDEDVVAWGEVWNFPLNKSIPTPDHYTAMDSCAEFFRKHEGFYCRLNGLASRSGDDRYNRDLSEKRCRNVHGYLMVHGDVRMEQLTHASGSYFIAMGEQAWQVLGVTDGKKSEKDRHRAVVMTVWKHNHPTMLQQMKVWKRIIQWDAKY
jgi:outer membrane protein OmpA-like peptidoglycan-associated protein